MEKNKKFFVCKCMSGGEGKELEGDGRDKITRILGSMGADRFGVCGQKKMRVCTSYMRSRHKLAINDARFAAFDRDDGS